jgi:hypothetical protein
MFHKGTRLPVVSACGVYMRRTSVPGVAVSIVGIALLASPGGVLAQRGGGRTQPGANSKPLICVHDCLEPHSGLGPEEDKELQRIMAVQANAQQTAAFASLMRDTQAASAQLQALRQLLQKVPIPGAATRSDRVNALDQAIEKAHIGNRNFLASLSPTQESGLKDISKKLEKADSELTKQVKDLDQVVATARETGERIANSAANLEKTFASFQDEQLALGREMSIVLPSDAQNLALSLPVVKSTIDVAGQSISIPVSGAVSRTSAADGLNIFGLRMVADLTDLQQNVTAALRSLLDRSPRCGERVEIHQVTLAPLAPATLVMVPLHYERWICPRVMGSETQTELATGEGAIEIKLTPSIERNTPEQNTPEQSARLALLSEISRVNGSGLLRESLLSGPLGAELRDQITTSLLPLMQKGADLKSTLPLAAQESAALQKVHFQDAGAGRLNLVLDGQLQLSDEQTKQFAAQLQQRLSAQEASAP